jgi:hypothetical protein
MLHRASVAGLFEHGNEPPSSMKDGDLLTERLLAPQDGLSSMELVSQLVS